jgi:dTDP-4-dehydrorhamnose 3,5-epimerase
MKFLKTNFDGLYIIKIEPFEDDRGLFYRIYCEDEFNEINHSKKIVQINYSQTKKKGIIRGLHFQYAPKMEIKIIKCINGAVFDVVVDLRKDSPTFLQWYGEILSHDNMQMIYIPEGFAHGFQTLSKDSELIYLHTEFYNPSYEGGISYNDQKINIKWPLEPTQISNRDKSFKLLDDSFEGLIV